MIELTQEEKRTITHESMGLLQPIIETHNLVDYHPIKATIEAFQAGVKYALEKSKEIKNG